MSARLFPSLARAAAPALRAPVARRYASTSAEEFVSERAHIREHAAKSADLWRKVSLYVCIPGSIVLGVYIYGIEAAHHAHAVHDYEEAGNQAPERTQYEYNLIRKKGFPWGDGSKSFFHNDLVNTPASP